MAPSSTSRSYSPAASFLDRLPLLDVASRPSSPAVTLLRIPIAVPYPQAMAQDPYQHNTAPRLPGEARRQGDIRMVGEAVAEIGIKIRTALDRGRGVEA